MTVRFTFRSEIFVEGKDLEEIVSKFESIPLFTEEAVKKYSADFVEIVSVDDEDTGEDLMCEYNELY